MSSRFLNVLQENYLLIIGTVVLSLFLSWGLDAPLGISSSPSDKKKYYFKTVIISILTTIFMMYLTLNTIEIDEVIPGQAPF